MFNYRTANLTIALRKEELCFTAKFASMSHKSILLFAVLGTLLFVACGEEPTTVVTASDQQNKFNNEKVLQIYKYKDRRLTTELVQILGSEDPVIRHEAALALGSVMDIEALPSLLTALKDTVWQVRLNATFSIGQLGDSTAIDALVNAYIKEPFSKVRLEMIQALGKCNSQRSIDLIDGYAPTTKEDSLGMMWGYYRLGLQRALSPVSITRTFGVLQTPRTWMRAIACHVLARSKDVKLDPYKELIMDHIRSEPEAVMRMALCMALQNVDDDTVREFLLEMAAEDKDARVRVNALRALSSEIHIVMVSSRIAEMIADPDALVRVQIARSLQKELSPKDVPALLSFMENEESWRVKAEVYKAILISRTDTETKERIRIMAKESFEQSSDRYEQGALLAALGGDPPSLDHIAKATFNTEEPVISTAGMGAMIEIHRSAGSVANDKLTEHYKKALLSGDITMIGLAAGAVREFNISGSEIDSILLASIRDGLELPREVEAWIELQKAIFHLSGIEDEVVPPSSPSPVDWEYIKKIPKDQQVRFETAKGIFVMDVFVEETPASVGRFLQSVEEGFYYGKTFHRVVPNFVAQGGCPRGDGWGSPDWSLRSEFTTRHYTTGAVGLASAGHDTESCQFFISHSPTPHLDGRYTLFGKVVEGMDVVQKLDVGDVIIKAELITDP